MLQLKIGIQLAGFRLPLKRAIARAAELGAQAVELDARGDVKPRELSETGIRQLRKMLEDFNLRVGAVSFRTRRGYDVPTDLDARIQATKDAMNLAYKLGAMVVTNQVGHIPSDSQGPGWDTLVDALRDLGEHGQRAGAMLAARTGAESGEDLARLIAALPPGHLGVDFDAGNLLVNGFSPSEAIKTLSSHVLYTHATDAVRDLARGRGLQTPLGQGAVDFPELLGVLEDCSYGGYFTVEPVSQENASQEMAHAVHYLRSL